MRDDRDSRREVRRDEPRREEAPRRSERSANFSYRTPESVQKRATEGGGKYDSIFRSDLPFISIKAGTNYKVRILPPYGWDGADHYAYPVWVHKQVGPDNQRYLCLETHGKEGEVCPVCAEYRELSRTDTKAAKNFKAKKSFIAYVIDRDHEDDGPKIWVIPWMENQSILDLSKNKRTGETYYVDHEEEGYDIEFDGIKKRGDDGKEFTVIGNLKIDPRATPISDDVRLQDKWCDFVAENPLPKILTLYPAEHIQKVLGGSFVREDDVDETPRTRTERTRLTRDDDRSERRPLRDEPSGTERRPLRSDSEAREPESRSGRRDGRREVIEDASEPLDEVLDTGDIPEDFDDDVPPDDDRRSSRNDDRRSRR